MPAKYELKQNYPNPFNPMTTIEFALPEAQHVTLKIYNIVGQEVMALVNKRLPAGKHEFEWNTSRHSGIASGVYLYKLETDAFTNIKKMILIK